jgi:hypothetical protein
MKSAEYQSAIPAVCPLNTLQQHWEYMGLCWRITHRKLQKCVDVEGPGCCHWCDISVAAARWIEKREDLFLRKYLEEMRR